MVDLLMVGIGTQSTDLITFVVLNPESYQVGNLPSAKGSFAPREQHVAPDCTNFFGKTSRVCDAYKVGSPSSGPTQNREPSK
jgi:hypothetical protein